MGTKLDKLDGPLLSVECDGTVPFGTVVFLSPRKYTEAVAIRNSGRGVIGTIERQYEPESEWSARCAMIRNAGVM